MIQIPMMDPNPLPAPFWMFKALLIITFFLHVLAMNLLLGGGFLTLILKWKKERSPEQEQLLVSMTKMLPSAFAATITLGVAPLLFLQVLYGQFFYTSTIIIAWPWFGVVLLLVLAYYGLYLVSFKLHTGKKLIGWVLLFSVIIIAIIAFLYTTNMTLLQNPAVWTKKYLHDPSGWNMNWEDLSLIPRYLHFLLGALAVAGLMIALGGLLVWKKNETLARMQIRFGGKWFMFVTMVQVVIGFIFLVTLPKEQMMLFMGQNLPATILLMAGIILSLAVIFLMSNALRNEDPRNGVMWTGVATAVLLLIMVIMRDLLRDSYLGQYFQPSHFQSATQWSVLILFLILFVAGIYLWVLMMKKYFFDPTSMQGE